MHLETLTTASGTSVVVRAHGLLSDVEQRALADDCFALESRFVDASISGAREDWRSGSIVYDPPATGLLVGERVRAIAAEVAARFGLPSLATIASLECQLALYGDGGFYKLHTDSRGPDVERRVLSYVHYVSRRPRPFEGGALRVVAPTGETCTVDPEDGTTAFFASELEHEVLPVRVPSGAFADGRFAITGWIWRP